MFEWLKSKQDKTVPGPIDCSETVSMSHRLDISSSLSFRLYPARGGVVFESTKYNQNGPNHTELYVISEDDSLVEQIALIIKMEYFKI